MINKTKVRNASWIYVLRKLSQFNVPKTLKKELDPRAESLLGNVHFLVLIKKKDQRLPGLYKQTNLIGHTEVRQQNLNDKAQGKTDGTKANTDIPE